MPKLANRDAVYEAASIWKERCLLKQTSIFTDEQIWTQKNINGMEKYFTNNGIGGNDQDFYQKLELQLSKAPANVKKLAGEMLWILFLFVNKSIGAKNKRANISNVWSWSGDTLNLDHKLLSDEALEGIGRCGMAYMNRRWAEINFLIDFLQKFSILNNKEEITNDVEKMDSWFNQIAGSQKQQFRPMIMHLLFPDDIEGSSSRADIDDMIIKYDNIEKKELKKMLWDEKNSRVRSIRKRLAKKKNDPNFSFYSFSDEWRREKKSKPNSNGAVNDNSIEYDTTEDQEKENHTTSTSLNQILFGPPGTGKTYNSINEAISIIDPDFDLNQDRRAIVKYYNQLCDKDQIVFTTFHQSMSYEDFVEGIKPIIDDENDDDAIGYHIKPGIFKTICKKANLETNSSISDTRVADDYKVIKISLGGKKNQLIHEWCINNGYMILGYGDNVDYSAVDPSKDINKQILEINPEISKDNGFPIQTQRLFHSLKKGDIVIASKGNLIIDAIGIVTGGYEYRPDIEVADEEYVHFRKVDWIAKDLNSSPDVFVRKQISQRTIYEFYDKDVKKDALSELWKNKDKTTPKPHVLIIDEINRGNISAIFGELITLIEDDKRLGQENELKVTLPYSKEQFSVPSNLHIIGTMNTADRSVEALDTALRRRFSFKEMMPKPEKLNTINGDIDLPKLLTTINQRLEYLCGRDNTIGHAFFMNVTSINDLRIVFKNKVIPQLQEYFYDNWKQISLVLGTKFVQKKEDSISLSWPAGVEQPDDDNHYLWEITPSKDWDSDSFKSIYNN